MTDKTSEELADEAMLAFSFIDTDEYSHISDDRAEADVAEQSYGFIHTQIISAIEADRAQHGPNNDGSIHGAVIIALRERNYFDDGAEARNRRELAAKWIEENPDDFWDRYAGPMLDEIEQERAWEEVEDEEE